MTKIISTGLPAGCKGISLKKISIKEGQKSGVKVGKVRHLHTEEMPKVGTPILGIYLSEYPQSGDPRLVRFKATSKVEKVEQLTKNIFLIDTQTSVYEARVS